MARQSIFNSKVTLANYVIGQLGANLLTTLATDSHDLIEQYAATYLPICISGAFSVRNWVFATRRYPCTNTLIRKEGFNSVWELPSGQDGTTYLHITNAFLRSDIAEGMDQDYSFEYVVMREAGNTEYIYTNFKDNDSTATDKPDYVYADVVEEQDVATLPYHFCMYIANEFKIIMANYISGLTDIANMSERAREYYLKNAIEEDQQLDNRQWVISKGK